MATSLFSPMAAAAFSVTGRPANSAVSPRAAYPTPSPTTLHFPSPKKLHFPGLSKPILSARSRLLSAVSTNASVASDSSSSSAAFQGSCYVLGDNIDTDQIIPAEHLTLVPSKPDEYRKLGSLALIGLPSSLYPVPFVEPGSESTRYPVIVAGANFGCGSSREHAPVALGASGVKVVVAESYARIFFRNSVATGEVYPVELEEAGAWKECSVGDDVVVNLGQNMMINRTTGKEYRLKPIGDAGPVIEAGGIFAYARKTGMIAA